MTGYTVHTGATEKFVAGWDEIFKKQRMATGTPAKKKASSKKRTSAKIGKAKGGKRPKKKT